MSILNLDYPFLACSKLECSFFIQGLDDLVQNKYTRVAQGYCPYQAVTDSHC